MAHKRGGKLLPVGGAVEVGKITEIRRKQHRDKRGRFAARRRPVRTTTRSEEGMPDTQVSADRPTEASP
jgi:hypothetical protein